MRFLNPKRRGLYFDRL